MSLLLKLHVALGAIGLVSGLAPLLLTKGTKLHTKLGGLFSLTMLLTGVSALVLTEANPLNILTPLAALSLNQVIIGHTSLYAKMKPMARGVAQIVLCLTLAFFAYSVFVVWPLMIQGELVGILTVAIASGLIPLSIQDARHLFGNFSRKLSIRIHASRMTGTYLAATIAFLVNVVSSSWITVLIPSMLGVGVIIYWSARISKQGMQGMELGNLRFRAK